MSRSTDRSRREYVCALGLAWLGVSSSVSLLRALQLDGAQGVWNATRTTLLSWGMAERAATAFLNARRCFNPQEAEAVLLRTGQFFVPYGSDLYPAELCQLASPPAGLFVRGPRKAVERVLQIPRFTVVGTRKATAEGLAAATGFVTALARRGIAVISGLALGIDAGAHRAALESGGATVAVLGCGADVVYPPRNRWLYERIASGGSILSELPPGANPTKWTFPHRNRLLAALGDAVLVVEGSNTSGALQTARWALEMGRPVYSVPGSIFKEASEGCNSLIYDGATPALRPEVMVEDFLEVTRMQRGQRSTCEPARAAPGEQMEFCTGAETEGPRVRVLAALETGPNSVDGLVTCTGLSVREVCAALGGLQVARLVDRAGPGMFTRAP